MRSAESGKTGRDHRSLVDRRVGAFLEVAQQPASCDPLSRLLISCQ
jgi:hypothetical protein